MPKLYLIFFTLISLSLNAQIETIKIKKDSVSVKKPVVTLAGIQKGEVSLTKLCSDKKYKIANNPGNYKVDFGIIHFINETKTLVEWVNSNDSLNNEFLKYLLGPRSQPKTKVHIYNITAKDQKGDTIKLNDIIITIIK